jgi:hypothetical protein
MQERNGSLIKANNVKWKEFWEEFDRYKNHLYEKISKRKG